MVDDRGDHHRPSLKDWSASLFDSGGGICFLYLLGPRLCRWMLMMRAMARRTWMSMRPSLVKATTPPRYQRDEFHPWVELEFMLEEIRIDRDQCREMAEKRGSEIAHLRALSENRWNTIERLTNQLESERARQTAAQELYVTSATCKVYHRNRQCYHIRTNSAVKTLKPCQDCCERP